MPITAIINAWRRQSVRGGLTGSSARLAATAPGGGCYDGRDGIQPAVARMGGFGGFGGLGGFELGFSPDTVGDERCCSTGNYL